MHSDPQVTKIYIFCVHLQALETYCEDADPEVGRLKSRVSALFDADSEVCTRPLVLCCLPFIHDSIDEMM